MNNYHKKLTLIKSEIPCESDISEKLIERLDELIDQYPDVAELWLERARWIQLAEAGEHYTLEDAFKSLQKALKIDSVSPEILEELGWFTYAVEDNALEAIPYFEQALALQKSDSAALGLAKSQIELGQFNEAEETLRSISNQNVDDIQNAWNELKVSKGS
jgi:tetratricopeptide (TPR) repeat protein